MDNGFVDVGGIEDFPVQNGVGSSNPQLQMSPKMNKEIAIDRIKEERTNADGEHEFLVKFKPVKETWVKATEVKKYPDLVQAFQKRKENAPKYHEDEEEEEEDGSDEDEEVGRRTGRKRAPPQRLVEQQVVKKSPRRRMKSKDDTNRSTNGLEEEEEEDDDVEDKEYTPEEILDKKVYKSGRETFLVKWKGYGPKYNSWEPRKNLTHLNVFKKFERDYELMSGTGKKGSEKRTPNKRAVQNHDQEEQTPSSSKKGRKAKKETSEGEEEEEETPTTSSKSAKATVKKRRRRHRF